ncbi:Sap, sulfolipid-1-addressing protein [Promicromonospora umidemergens]|uniref:GAP family protein n=1 Tax=Promicromonospora umidemergens TaxID=629679 RepID=A0ABP8YD08_9MICO|nr:GAP family protein [Promicromonospora umidemergens]MCP2285269.1 Sap, sulfolipid-1-addressing protein [Promicromonospora umidemergens]
MDFLSAELTGTALVGALAVLALIDSTSFGTLLIPVWLLMSPGRVRVGRMLVYLGSIAGFYALIGLAILLGAGALSDTLTTLSSTLPFLVVQLVIGVGLFAWSFKLEPVGGRKPVGTGAVTGAGAESGAVAESGAAAGAGAGASEPAARAGRLGRWRERVLGSESGSRSALALLAVGAGLVEVATMLPYLAALGLIGTQGPGWPTSGLWILAYCLVMIAPALVLTAARVFAARLVERPLGRLDTWLTKNAASTTAWVVGIVGFLVARDAIGRLWG